MDPVTKQINQLAACNVPGRIRAAMSDIRGGNTARALSGLNTLLAFVEQRDPKDEKEMSKIIEVRKVPWDMLWHLVYMRDGKETWDRVSRKEALACIKRNYRHE